MGVFSSKQESREIEFVKEAEFGDRVGDECLVSFWKREWVEECEEMFQSDVLRPPGLFSMLNMDVLLVVMQFLDPADVAKLSRVSKWFMIACNDSYLWTILYTNHFGGLLPEFSSRADLRNYWRSQAILAKTFMNQDPISETITAHEDGVNCIMFDDERLISGAKDNKLKYWVWVDNSLELRHTLPAHYNWIWGCKFTKDRLVTCARDRCVFVWSLYADHSAPFLQQRLRGHSAVVTCLQFDNDKVITGSNDRTLRIWPRSVSSDEGLYDAENCSVLAEHTGGVFALAYNSTCLLSGSKDERVIVWDLETLKQSGVLSGHKNMIRAIQFDERRIVTGAGDGLLKIWDPRTILCVHSLAGHTSHVKSLQYDDYKIVSGAKDCTVRVWDIRKCKEVRVLQDHCGPVYGVQFEGRRLVTCSFDNTIKIWHWDHVK
eukprot:TRINITY_DN4878_c0_g1_i1.p1 TRINITY_DN4878_c0_g1~~TRINITY_DN4878_c0_g1_i1.p1  ORF type:complete len:432 (-),score=53.65 TRINITY_DN4878_c0_g1_i1:1399-2694(-)